LTEETRKIRVSVVPRPPKTVEETGLSLGFLVELACKTLYFGGVMSLSSLSEQLALPVSVSNDVMDFMKKERLAEVKKGGELRDTTVLFTDIRGFTAMSESAAPQHVVDMLNEYFELMVEIIFKYQGTLDKFIGDEIMVLYGAPLVQPDATVRAVRTALEMQLALEEFNRTTIAEGNDPIRVGIGINSGEVVAGYMGSSKTMEYTAIGDTVNTASRLCSIARAGEIIVSEPTWERVREFFEGQPLPPAKLKGKAHALQIYSITGIRKQWGDEMTKPGAP